MKTLISAIAVGALALASMVAINSNPTGRAQDAEPINCDANEVWNCVALTQTARAELTATVQLGLDIEATVADAVQAVWNSAGATMTADREFLFGQIATANARLEQDFLPRYCVDHRESDYHLYYREHYRGQPDHHSDHEDILDQVFIAINDQCILDNVASAHDLVAPTATAIAQLTATAIAESGE